MTVSLLRNAIILAVHGDTTSLQSGTRLELICGGEEIQSGKNLPGIPGYPEGNFLKYAAGPNVSDFKVMLDARYPVTDDCSGWCVSCDRHDRVKNCHCAFAEVSCEVTARGAGSPQRIDLVGYKTSLYDLVSILTLFNTKDEDFYKVKACKFECREMPPDIAATSKAGVEMQFFETEPSNDDSPLKETLSRRELAALEDEGCSELLHAKVWVKLNNIGQHLCPGRNGLLTCWYSKGTNFCLDGVKIIKCPDWERTCHRFGPQSADVYAVQDAAMRYLLDASDCRVTCGSVESTSNRLWEEARTYLRHAPGYERLWPSYNELSELPNFRDAITVQHPTQKRDVLDCDPDNCTVTSDRVCRIARVSCEIEQSGSQESRSAESIKFNTRLQDAFRTLSIPNANAKDNGNLKNKQCAFECYGELWPEPDKWPLE
ncbi:hypothetical protein GNI_173370 [Gregarina niphandrodes]|uniref:Uncharacterized protein n=1 Tax=Gregarina niphandrodes TaxID=110365 RepID=A0A023AYA1_GRENI|nr:hypothetical protein GNI_173370 [Gregarina niphandrodes]EZG43403.1 hypothetical protein GNI_173370 [Gregarina niphandrodes]|eukprot:XP_011133366.1 hypothetical protein GNI_173370 [Gregarina niphandrodes]